MLNLDDDRWADFKGGYRRPFDARPALRMIRSSGSSAAGWKELWNNLYHQGDVGEASYAAVPHLVSIHKRHGGADWNLYAFVATVELARHRRQNPPVPDWLLPAYEAAWKDLAALAVAEFPMATDPVTIRSILGVLALSKQLRACGSILTEFSEDELLEIQEEHIGNDAV